MQTVMILSPDVIDLFRSSLYAKGRSDQTAKAYCSDLRVLLHDTGNGMIQREDFEEVAGNWLTTYRRVVQPKTTGRRLTSLRAFARWANWGPMLADYNAPTPPKGDPHPLPEGVAGVRRMIAAAPDKRQKALIALLGMAGLRVAEALNARPSHFNLQTMELTVRGKGDKTRVLPISTEAWSYLEESVYRAFIAGDDQPIVGFKDRFARSLITRLGQKAGLVRRVASHDLRATFATEVYNKTLDQRVVQELLGHASGEQTEVYIGVSKANMRKAVEL